MIRTRFAPSPTGFLHVGNVRTAMANWLYAKKHNGEFMLRIDDTDLTRSKDEYTTAIKKDMEWLGLKWDLTAHQRDREARYEEVKQSFIKKGLLYPCYETPDELELKRKIQLGQGKPPIYDRVALKLSQEKIDRYIQEGRKPHYRFKLAEKAIEWNDMVRGKVRYESMSMSDPILIREDGSWTYMLCSVIDDVDFKISHIIRGDDHVNNTAIHIQIFEALDAIPPLFAHLPRITTKTAEISKRTGGFDIKSLREEKELEAMTVNNFLAKIGTSEPATAYTKLEPLINEFDITKYHKSPTNYDEEELIKLNHKILAELNFDLIKDRAAKIGIMGIDQEFWNSVRHNISKFSEVKLWYNICKEVLAPQINQNDKQYLLQAIQLLPNDQWNEQTWSKWTNEIKKDTGRNGKELFMPIRLALTAMEHGPELKFLLPLIGKEKVVKRLNGERA